MSAHKHINLEVKESAKPIVHDLAKENMLSFSKKIVATVMKESLNVFIELQIFLTKAKCFRLFRVYFLNLYLKIVRKAFL